MKIEEIAYHRNGVGGQGFHVVTFRDRLQGRRESRMVAIVFDYDEPQGQCAVFDRELLGAGNITAYEDNCFRGDDTWGKELRKAIREWEKARSLAGKEQEA